jgi:hypothetical protein
MTSEAQRQFRYKANIKKYLLQLKHLTRRDVSATDLMTLAETDALREKSKKIERLPVQKFTIPFADRDGSAMKALVAALYARHQSRIYLWTELANICGGLWLGSILDFNFNFDFDVDSNGVFSLLSEDLRQKLVLDFGDLEGNQMLEVELSGDAWGLAPLGNVQHAARSS